MFEHITRTLDTDRKSIPEQINVLRFFKVTIYIYQEIEIPKLI